MGREKPEERGKPIDQRCQYVFEDREQCVRRIDGQGAWQFCSEHRIVGPIQAKKLRDSGRRKEDDKREEDNFYHFLYYHGLTKKQLSDGIATAQLLRDLWPAARDDQHDFALNKLQDIKGLFLYNPLPLPEVIDDALSSVRALLDQLDKRHPNDFIAARLWAYCLELDCSIGRPIYSKRSFGPLRKRIVTAQKAWSNQGDLINLSRALCLHADFCRGRFFQESNHHKHLDDAERWLNRAQDVLGYCPNQGELAVLRMRHNSVCGKFRIKFDQGAKSDELRDEIDFLRELAADIDDPKISFLTACYETEWSIYAGETAQAEQYLKNVVELFPQIGINPFNLREYTLRFQTVLAHKQGRFGERDAYFKDYITLFLQEPTIHGYHGLKELRQLYGNLPEPCTFTARPRLYVNLMFTGLQEDLIRF